jgi:hypothetical protein
LDHVAGCADDCGGLKMRKIATGSLSTELK